MNSASMSDVEQVIPHRPPFLFVDEVLEQTPESIRTRRTWRSEEFFYEGHYPGNPLTPGVLLCEACFQTGAILLATNAREAGDNTEGTPVLSRIGEAKFKQMVRPGDTIEIEATLKEAHGKFNFMRAVVRKDGKVAMTVEFALALVAEDNA